MNLGNSYTKVESYWKEAKNSGHKWFYVPMEDGRNFIICHKNSSFSVYLGQMLLVNDITSTKDLTEVMVGFGIIK